IRGGVVHGASDKMGAHPKDGRVEPQDLWATVIDRMGIDPETEFKDPQGRPFPISRGKVIDSILA
ncbi:MAG: DUF1501 domain-containing protein, partial [Gemmataceae bacterium]